MFCYLYCTANGSTCQVENVFDLAVHLSYTMGVPDEKRTFERPLQVRVTDEQLELFKRAAEKDGRPLSSWVRDRLTKNAKKELK